MKLAVFFHTLRYLKLVQIYGRLWVRLYNPKIDNHTSLECRELAKDWLVPVAKEVSMLGSSTVSFLNCSRTLSFPEDWNHPGWEILWLYNLHYFDDLNAKDAFQRKEWHQDLVEKWCEDNPVAKGYGWDSYPTSLRIVNWIKWVLAGNSLPASVMQSLVFQTRYLRKRLEFHLLGNHLLANAKALVFAGLFFQSAEAEEWLKKGLKILERELAEQVLADGGHFERSPMYHAIILEDLMDIINALQTYDYLIPETWPGIVKKMLEWLRGMIHPDEEISFFNDAAMRTAPGFSDLQAYAQRLGILSDEISISYGLTHFVSSGYIRWSGSNAVALLDVAPVGPDYLPGHAHADTLSFELSLHGQRLFVNSGTSCYGVSDERLRQRSTAAHNTVEVDGESSSEVWSGFRVARRARPKNLSVRQKEDGAVVSCVHDGYLRLPGKVIHRRSWAFGPHQLIVEDQLLGNYKSAKARLHFHPNVIVKMVGDSKVNAQFPGGDWVCIEINGASCVNLEEGTWHPEFGLSLPNFCLVSEVSESQLVTSIHW